MIKYIIVLLSLLSFLHAKTSIVVTFPVHKEFIQKIAKDDFFIKVIEDGYQSFDKRGNLFKNEIYYSDVYLTLGLEEEKKYIELFKKKNRYMKIIDVSKGIEKDIVNGKVNHYIWTDPLLVRELVKSLYNTLSSLKSYKKEFYEANHKVLLKELDEFFLSLKKKFDRNEFYNIYVYEPYWHYIAKRYRINLYYKENKFTDLEEVPALIEHAQLHNIEKVLIRKGSSYEQAQSLASHINADIVEHDITEYNWKVNIQSLARKIARYKKNL